MTLAELRHLVEGRARIPRCSVRAEAQAHACGNLGRRRCDEVPRDRSQTLRCKLCIRQLCPWRGLHLADIDDLTPPGNARKKRRGTGNGNGGTDAAARALPTSVRDPARHPKPNETELLATALEALHRGEFSLRLRPRDGVSREVAEAFNDLAERLDHSALELARLTRVVGRDGEMGERMRMDGLRGGWETIGDSFNTLIGDLTRPTTEVARVLIAVAEGDLSQKMALEIRRQAGPRRVPPHRHDRESNGRSAPRVRERGHARRARGRKRRQARRTGERARRRRYMEGPHRHRERDGVEPHDAGAQASPASSPRSRTATSRRSSSSRRRARSSS